MSAAPVTTPAPSADRARRSTRRSDRRDARRLVPFRLAGGTLAVWLLLAVASASWWPVYRDPAMLTAAVTAIVIGTVVALLGTLFRLPTAVVAIATVAAFTVSGVPAAAPSQANGLLPTGRGFLDLFAGVALGWKQLVTISLPVGSYEALLVPYFVTLLVATVTAVSVATRASRQELASIPALVLFAVGVVVGPSRLDTSIVTAVVLVGIALVWALTVRHARPRGRGGHHHRFPCAGRAVDRPSGARRHGDHRGRGGRGDRSRPGRSAVRGPHGRAHRRREAVRPPRLRQSAQRVPCLRGVDGIGRHPAPGDRTAEGRVRPRRDASTRTTAWSTASAGPTVRPARAPSNGCRPRSTSGVSGAPRSTSG
ncbi:hypothetical protein Q9Q99_04265 [Curtobacterium flaccumfaciens]|nr:hypothetical protein Q9Q99_04265 [Curtobacterium flaccumfaciens]